MGPDRIVRPCFPRRFISGGPKEALTKLGLSGIAYARTHTPPKVRGSTSSSSGPNKLTRSEQLFFHLQDVHGAVAFFFVGSECFQRQQIDGSLSRCSFSEINIHAWWRRRGQRPGPQQRRIAHTLAASMARHQQLNATNNRKRRKPRHTTPQAQHRSSTQQTNEEVSKHDPICTIPPAARFQARFRQ